MSTLLAEHGSTFAAADRLLSLNARGEEAERLLAGLLESLYRLARTSACRQELRSWIERHAPGVAAIRPWLFLVQLAESTRNELWQAALESLKNLLPLRDARADLYLRTEAAREVYRLTADPAAAGSLFRWTELPDPGFAETAVDSVLLRLRLCAVAGEWEEHDCLANGCDRTWIKNAGPQAHWVEVGRAYERFALQATALGIRNAFLNQPVEVAAVRSAFAESLGLTGQRPDLVVRFGRGPTLPRSLRRPVDSVMG